MSRPSQGWEVLGENGDPVPGDPDEVARLGRELRRTADAIEKEADEIRALASVESWKGKSADEFRDRARSAEGKLRKALHRYDEAAKALGTDVVDGTYAGELHRAQKLADTALRDAQDADAEHTATLRALDRKPPDTPDDDPSYATLATRRDAAATALHQARAALHTATTLRDTAARHAAARIRHAIDHDGLKDGRWDRFKNWVHENAGWIQKIADLAGIVATVCGLLSLCVGWIPVIGQALAGILGTVALLATVVSLAAHLVLALAGEGAWFDVVLDVVGLATFGIGRGALAGARGASAGTRALARTTRFRQEMEQVAARGVKRGSPAWARAQQAAWRRANRLTEGAPRGKNAAEVMANAPRGWFPGASRALDAANPVSIARESWHSVRELRAFRDLPQVFHRATWQGVRFRFGDPGLATEAAELARANVANLANHAVRAGTDVFRTQTRVWIGSTVFGSGTDAADKLGLWEKAGLT